MTFRSCLTRGVQRITRASQWASAMLTGLTMSSPVLAELPTLEEPTQTGDGGLRSTAQGYIYDGVVLAGLALTAIAFLWVASQGLAAFSEARARGEWGKFAVTLFVGVFVLLLIIWLATEAVPILSQ